MRKKFDTDPDASAERFEFREEYWEQAQALLEAEEKRRRKRRRWLIWWFFVGLLVAVGGWQWAMGNWQWATGGGQLQENSNLKHSQSDDAGSRQQGQYSNGEAAGQTAIKDDIQAQGDGAASGLVSGEKTPGADSFFLKNKIENQGFGTKDEAGGSNKPRQDTRTQRESGTNNTPGQKNRTRQEIEKEKNTRAGQKGQAGRDRETPASLAPAPQVQAEQLKNDALIPVTQHAGAIGRLSDTAKVLSSRLDALSKLPTLLGLLELPPRDLDTPSASSFVRPIKPVHERKLSFGLTAAGMLSQASSDGKKIGAVGGIFASCRLRPEWSLGLGVQWRFLPGYRAGDTTAVETSEQLRYSFGFVRDEWRLETKGLHYLEVPLALRRRFGALSVEGGAATGILMGVRAQVTQRHSESLVPETIEQGNTWADKSPYRTVYVAPFLGAEWQAVRHLGLSLRGHYRPSSLPKPTDADAPIGGGLWWLDVGLRWHF